MGYILSEEKVFPFFNFCEYFVWEMKQLPNFGKQVISWGRSKEILCR